MIERIVRVASSFAEAEDIDRDDVAAMSFVVLLEAHRPRRKPSRRGKR